MLRCAGGGSVASDRETRIRTDIEKQRRANHSSLRDAPALAISAEIFDRKIRLSLQDRDQNAARRGLGPLRHLLDALAPLSLPSSETGTVHLRKSSRVRSIAALALRNVACIAHSEAQRR